MGRREEIVEKVRAIAAPLAAGEGLELVDVELGGGGGRTTLRLYIDRKGGVSLDDCTSISRAVSAALDVEDPIEGRYDLEVSSPGLDRPLRTPEHFQTFAGEEVRIKAFGPIPELENRKTFHGILRGFEDGRVLVEVDGTVFRVPRDQIAKAHLEARVDDLSSAEPQEPEARLHQRRPAAAEAVVGITGITGAQQGASEGKKRQGAQRAAQLRHIGQEHLGSYQADPHKRQTPQPRIAAQQPNSKSPGSKGEPGH